MKTTSNTSRGGAAASASPVPRAVVVLVATAAVALIITGLQTSADIVGPVFLALVLTITVHPLRPWLTTKGVPGWLATVLVLLAIYGILAVLVASILYSSVRLAQLVPTYKEEGNQLLTRLSAALADAGIDVSRAEQVWGRLEPGQVISGVQQFAGGVYGVVAAFILVVTVLFFMVADDSWFPERVQQLPRRRRHLARALTQFAWGTRRYMVVATVFGLIVAVFDTIALSVLGIPLAVVWGMLAFVTNYIPNVGFVIGLLPPAVLGLLEGGPRLAIIVILIYSLLNFVIQSLIQPRVAGGAVGLSGTVTMLSLVFWAFALGAVGALMAVPLTLFVKALLIDADPRAAWVTPLLARRQLDGGGSGNGHGSTPSSQERVGTRTTGEG